MSSAVSGLSLAPSYRWTSGCREKRPRQDPAAGDAHPSDAGVRALSFRHSLPVSASQGLVPVTQMLRSTA